jgi:hypothetical protein
MVRRVLLPLLLLAASTACHREDLDAAARTPQASFARESLALLLKKDAGALATRYAPDVAAAATPDVTRRMLDQVPPGTPSEPILVGAEFFERDTVQRSQFSYEYAYPSGYVLGLVVVDSSGPAPLVAGIHLRRMPDTLARVNAFRLAGKSRRHFAVLAAALAVAAFVLYALVACARTPLRHRWLWLCFVALGLGRASLNWTTGDLRFTPLWVQPLGAGASAAGRYAPWFVTVSLPLGAILFVALRSRLRSAGE